MAYRRTVATSAAAKSGALAPLLSVVGHIAILTLFLTASIAVRETPSFEDFTLMDFAGGEVVEVGSAQPDEPSAEEILSEAELAEETSARSEAVEEVAALEEVTDVAALADSPYKLAPEVIEADAPVPLGHEVVAQDVSLKPAPEAVLQPASLASEAPPAPVQESTLEPVAPTLSPLAGAVRATGFASVPHPTAEALIAATPAPAELEQAVVAEAEPLAAAEALPLAAVAMDSMVLANKRPLRLPARRQAPQQAALPSLQPFTAEDRLMAERDPELWQVVSALRAQLARCWDGPERPGTGAQFLDLDVAFDRGGRVSLARVRDAGRLLRDPVYGREARRARAALKSCSPFLLPEEYYALWQRVTLRFVLALPSAGS